MTGEGLRYNEGKTRHDLVPTFAQEQYAKVLTLGAVKYAERNWEKGMPWSKVIASMERHVEALKRGEDFDPETGLLHSAQIMTNAAFLTEYYRIYPQGDDRPLPYLHTPKIGLDIDEVLCDWVAGWIEMFDMEVPKSWFFDREIIEKFDALKEKGKLDEFYLGLKPLISPDEIPFEPYCYVTSRPVKCTVTKKWLDKYGFPARPVHTVGLNESKLEVIKSIGIDIFVDDRYETFVELNNAGICCYLMDKPHNERYDVGHKRIYHLSDLMTMKHMTRESDKKIETLKQKYGSLGY